MAIAVIFVTLMSVLLVRFDFNERFIVAVASHEDWQIDEFPLVLLVIYAAMTWFSVRRWNESRQEINARIQAEHKVTQLLSDNQQLLRHALEVQEEERRSLARELHDELGQYLHAARTESAALRLISREPLVAECAVSLEQVLTHIQLVARDIISRLRPPALDALGLSAALEHLVKRQCETLAGLDCRLDIGREIDGVDSKTAINVYRIAQECLTNIVRHSSASCVDVVARIKPVNAMPQSGEIGVLMLEISDNGRGYPDAFVAGFGIAGMRERVQSLGGTINLHSQPHMGVCVSVSLPLFSGAELNQNTGR